MLFIFPSVRSLRSRQPLNRQRCGSLDIYNILVVQWTPNPPPPKKIKQICGVGNSQTQLRVKDLEARDEGYRSSIY